MSNPNTRKVLLAIFVIVVVSLSCKSPGFTPKGVDLDDEVFQYLASNFAGIYETGELHNFTENLENECTPGAPGKPGRKETLEFKDNKLIVSDENGERTYVYQGFGYQQFCRELDDGKIECLSHFEKNKYSLTVYESKNNLSECFRGQRNITLIDIPQEEDPLAAPGDLPGSSDSISSVCIPKPEEYTLEIVNLTDRSNDVKRHCNADGLFTNNSDQKLMFSAYRVHNYGGWDYEKWDGSGNYTIVEPGETVECTEFYRCTGGSCGDGAWYYFTHISILYYTPECAQYTFEHDEKAPNSIIEIQNPCDW